MDLQLSKCSTLTYKLIDAKLILASPIAAICSEACELIPLVA